MSALDQKALEGFYDTALVVGRRFYDAEPPVLTGAMSLEESTGFMIMLAHPMSRMPIYDATVGVVDDEDASDLLDLARNVAKDIGKPMAKAFAVRGESSAVLGIRIILSVAGLPRNVNQLFAACILREQREIHEEAYRSIVERDEYAHIPVHSIMGS